MAGEDERVRNLEADLREVRTVATSAREMGLENRLEVGYLQRTAESLLAFRDSVSARIAEREGGEERAAARSARVVQVIGLIGGALGVVSTVLVILDQIVGLW